MAPYSMDLRSRVLRDSEAGMPSKDVAAKYAVSRSWVDRVKQRKRETGEVAPRQQTVFRRRALTSAQQERLVALVLARPDATLAELREALPTTAALSTLWRALDQRGWTVKKNGTRGRTAAARCSDGASPLARHAAAARRGRLCLPG